MEFFAIEGKTAYTKKFRNERTSNCKRLIEEKKVFVAVNGDNLPCGMISFDIVTEHPFGFGYGTFDIGEYCWISLLYADDGENSEIIKLLLLKHLEKYLLENYSNVKISQIWCHDRCHHDDVCDEKEEESESVFTKSGYNPKVLLLYKNIKEIARISSEYNKDGLFLRLITAENVKDNEIDFILHGHDQLSIIEDDHPLTDEQRERYLVYIKQLISEHKCFLLCKPSSSTTSGIPTGFIAFQLSNQYPMGFNYGDFGIGQFVWISSVFIDEKERQRGYGKLMYLLFEEKIKLIHNIDSEQIWLDVYCINSTSLSFHEKLGYKITASLLFKDLN